MVHPETTMKNLLNINSQKILRWPWLEQISIVEGDPLFELYDEASGSMVIDESKLGLTTLILKFNSLIEESFAPYIHTVRLDGYQPPDSQDIACKTSLDRMSVQALVQKNDHRYSRLLDHPSCVNAYESSHKHAVVVLNFDEETKVLAIMESNVTNNSPLFMAPVYDLYHGIRTLTLTTSRPVDVVTLYTHLDAQWVVPVEDARCTYRFSSNSSYLQVAKILYRLNGALRKRNGSNVFIKLANDNDKFVSLTTKPGPRMWETTYRQRKSENVLFWEGDSDSQTWFKVTNLYYNTKDYRICTWLKKIAKSANEILGIRKAGKDARVTVWFQADEKDQEALVNRKIRKFLGRNVLITLCSAPAAGANYLVQDMVMALHPSRP